MIKRLQPLEAKMFFSLAAASMFQQKEALSLGSLQCVSPVKDEISKSLSYVTIQAIHYKCKLTNIMSLPQNDLLQSQQLIASWLPSAEL